MFNDIQNYDLRNLMAAEYVDKKRLQMIAEKKNFVFETVMSTTRNLELLKEAKAQGAEITTIYVLTRDKEINVKRVAKRISQGGHAVPVEKIRERYDKCMSLLPEIIDVSDKVIIYDNSIDFQTSIMLHKN